MDRLVIEAILADVEEIKWLNNHGRQEMNPVLLLIFKTENSNEVKHAFVALKNVSENSNIELVICRTLVSGLYDLEIKTDALDEPVRICNKMIVNEMLNQIEDYAGSGERMTLITNLSEEDGIKISKVIVKECMVK